MRLINVITEGVIYFYKLFYIKAFTIVRIQMIILNFESILKYIESAINSPCFYKNQ
jgi:hypothetical protein